MLLLQKIPLSSLLFLQTRRSSNVIIGRRSITTGNWKDLEITDRAVKQLLKINSRTNIGEKSGGSEQAAAAIMKNLRIQIDAGGCHGYQYKMELTDDVEEDDIVFEKDSAKFLTDSITLDMLRGSKLDYVDELIGAAFAVVDNPNAESSCGCKVSFNIKQPNNDTWMKQCDLWIELLLDWSRKERKFILSQADERPFKNPQISRSLNKETIQLLFEKLVKDGKGEWTSKEKGSVYIYWKSPDEWATLIYKWIFDTGKTGSVVTLYEILHGDETTEEEFYEADELIIKKALDILTKKGQATIFSSSDGSLGIKFI